MRIILPHPIVILTILLFLFCSTTAYPAAPSVGSITPSSGTSNPNETVTFVTTYTDPDGWTNIQYIYLLINTSTSGAYCFYGYYNQNTNKLYLRNDAGTGWLGGYTPGSVNVIENLYTRLNCAATTVSGSGTTLTVTWSVTFKSTFTGAKNTYLYVRDDTNLYNGWTKKGTWTIVNQTPSLGTITPSSGTSNPNDTVSFTITYTDPDGWQNIVYAYLLTNTSTSGANCFYGYYNRNSNKLYLRNDANTSWLGGYTPGSSNIIENSYTKLNCAGTTLSGSGTTLTITWSVTFKSTFAGSKNTYLKVTDNANSSAGWTKKGTWTITNQLPSVGTITPSSGASTPDVPIAFTTTYIDPDGWLNIQYVNLLINTSVNGANSFYGYYNQNTNKLYLRNDANTSWLGGYTPGSSNIIQNTYVKLNCTSTTISGSGTTLTVNWNITFKPVFTGAKNTYLYVKDDANASNGWIQTGTWAIDNTPPTGSILINNNAAYTNSNQVTLTLSAADSESGVSEMQFSNDNTNWSTPEEYNTTKVWGIPSGDGVKTVYTKFKNGVGLWSNIYSDDIILDSTLPEIDITTPEDGSTVIGY